MVSLHLIIVEGLDLSEVAAVQSIGDRAMVGLGKAESVLKWSVSPVEGTVFLLQQQPTLVFPECSIDPKRLDTLVPKHIEPRNCHTFQVGVAFGNYLIS